MSYYQGDEYMDRQSARSYGADPVDISGEILPSLKRNSFIELVIIFVEKVEHSIN